MPNNENLSRHGYSFQTKLITCVLTDTLFISQVYDILKEEYFDSESTKWIIHKCFSYYNQYKKIPTLDVLKVYSDKIDDELLRHEVVNTLRDSIKHIGATDLDFIKDTVILFCRRQEIKSAILQAVELVNLDKIDEIVDIVNKASKVGMSSDIGLEYLEDIETRYTEDARNPIATGWPVLNILLKGGLAAGEVGMFMANSGIGKSWLLSHVGAHAIKEGKTVFHYTLELEQSYSALRYDAIISGISLDKLPIHKDRLKEVLKEVPGKLFIKWYAMRSISLMGIRAHIEKARMLGIVPELIIIDYVDLLKYTGKKDKDDQILKEISEEVKGFAGELQLPVWTVSQVNRAGAEDDYVEATKVAGSYGKIFAYDFVASLSRKRQDKISNTARMHIVKNRLGADGMSFPVMMDTNRGVIEIYDEVSQEGKQTQERMKSDDRFAKENARKKYNEFMNNTSKKTDW